MTCSRCSSPLLNQLQFDRGLCASCLTGSLSALVAVAAEKSGGLSTPAPDAVRLGRSEAWSGLSAPETAHVIPIGGSQAYTAIQTPICFADFEGLPRTWPSDTAWKSDVFGDGEIQ